MPGKVVINWNGKDDSGEKYWNNIMHLKLRVQSVYDPNMVINYSFEFHPSGNSESLGSGLPKSSGPEALPEIFEVFPNFPNPFNNITHIRYQLPEKGKVKIVLYNVLGQRVKTLVNEFQETGGYTVQWDGRNEQGTEVGSGVYFYQVTYANHSYEKVKINKILLIK